MKKIVGRQKRAKATATLLASGSPAMVGDIAWTSSGAMRTAMPTMRPSATMTRVSSRLAYASPPSSSFFIARTSCGTKTEFRPPPMVRM